MIGDVELQKIDVENITMKDGELLIRIWTGVLILLDAQAQEIDQDHTVLKKIRWIEDAGLLMNFKPGLEIGADVLPVNNQFLLQLSEGVGLLLKDIVDHLVKELCQLRKEDIHLLIGADVLLVNPIMLKNGTF